MGMAPPRDDESDTTGEATYFVEAVEEFEDAEDSAMWPLPSDPQRPYSSRPPSRIYDTPKIKRNKPPFHRRHGRDNRKVTDV